MTRAPHRATKVACSKRRNLLALAISFTAVSWLYFNFNPTPAEADPLALAALEASTLRPTEIVFDDPVPVPEAAPTSERADGSPVAADVVVRENDRTNLLVKLLLLERGLERLKRVPGYSASFYKRERVAGSLLEEEVMQMKIRHEPFSVYMKWLVGDKGRELLYVDGENEGNMLVHAGGWKARLLPALKLDPNGALAMAECRYPVTMAGLRPLVERMIEYRRRDLDNDQGFRCRMRTEEAFDGRPCFAFQLEFPNRAACDEYRKCLVYVDKELSLPVYVQNWCWPHEDEEIAADQLDDATLIEHYHFTKIDMGTRLASADFDRTNRKYGFKRIKR